MSIVPDKYHTFISPPLRRVFLDVREDNRDSGKRPEQTMKENLNRLRAEYLFIYFFIFLEFVFRVHGYGQRGAHGLGHSLYDWLVYVGGSGEWWK